AGDSALLSFRAAGALWQLDGVERGPVEVTMTSSRGLRTSRVVVHRAETLAPSDRRTVEGIPVTSPERTLVDMARVLDERTLELAIEDALRRGLTTPERARERLDALGGRGRSGAAMLRRLLDLRHPRPAESGLEVDVERFLRERGLGHFFVRQYDVWDGERRRRLDWAAPEHRVALEADGWRYHSGRQAWSADRARNDRLEALGWLFVSMTGQSDPDMLESRIRHALERAA
ncbi:MAG: hypothetical protein ACRDHK_15575, partial [Actinomycetota bacterium]